MFPLSAMLLSAMREKGVGVRALERAIVDRFGADKMISRTLISDYCTGKMAPTYERALMIAEVLGLDKPAFLKAAYEMRRQLREEAERKRFDEFCKHHGIEVEVV